MVSTPKQAERSRRILAAALAEFSQAGFAEGSIDRIPRVAGVAKTTIYRHYPHKRDLFKAVFQAALGHLRMLSGPGRGRMSFEMRVRNGLRQVLLAVRRDPAILLIFRSIGPDSGINEPQLRAELGDAYLEAGHWAIDEIRTAQALGALRDDFEPERLFLAILGLIHGQVHLWLRRGRAFDLGRSATLVGDLLFDGIRPTRRRKCPGAPSRPLPPRTGAGAACRGAPRLRAGPGEATRNAGCAWRNGPARKRRNEDAVCGGGGLMMKKTGNGSPGPVASR